MTTERNPATSTPDPITIAARRSRRRFLTAVPAVMTIVPAQAAAPQSSATACIQRGSTRAPSAAIADINSDDWLRVAVPVLWVTAPSRNSSLLSGGVTRLPRGVPAADNEFACIQTTDGRRWRLVPAVNGYDAQRLNGDGSHKLTSRPAQTDLFALIKVDADGNIRGLAFEQSAQSGFAVTTSCYTSAAPLRRA